MHSECSVVPSLSDLLLLFFLFCGYNFLATNKKNKMETHRKIDSEATDHTEGTEEYGKNLDQPTYLSPR